MTAFEKVEDFFRCIIAADHDYAVKNVAPEDLPMIKQKENEAINEIWAASLPSTDEFAKRFSKCDKCRKSRTKVLVPDSLLSIASGKNDGVTCDFCGEVMNQAEPATLPDVFEGRRGSKGGDLRPEDRSRKRNRSYVYCGVCSKVVLRESLNKHIKDVHEKSNKVACKVCGKILSGTFSLKEHVNAVHKKQARHECPQCDKHFAHFSNMNRHIRLVHQKMVVTHKYVNCGLCNKIVQSTSLKKHMASVHEQRRDFECGFCEKSFAQMYSLREHICAKHTRQHCHSCKLCGKSFAHKTNCGRHLKGVHKKEIERRKYDSDVTMIKELIQTKPMANDVLDMLVSKKHSKDRNSSDGINQFEKDTKNIKKEEIQDS